ncbi:MAG: hypothetical protein PF549_01830 [Patescibacteria group bacterium]|jgi:hypothetical protein|nr:hypothetical protein [Patescibacteria group bacterium]
MNLSEIKQLINASGGKLILSDGNLKDSFIVMKIEDYLIESRDSYECNCSKENGECFSEIDFSDDGKEKTTDFKKELTDVELLDKINSDIEELKKRKQEDDLVNLIEDDFLDRKEDELNYEKI